MQRLLQRMASNDSIRRFEGELSLTKWCEPLQAFKRISNWNDRTAANSLTCHERTTLEDFRCSVKTHYRNRRANCRGCENNQPQHVLAARRIQRSEAAPTSLQLVEDVLRVGPVSIELGERMNLQIKRHRCNRELL